MSVMVTSAVLSDCRRYRYRLNRRWDSAGPTVLFVMLNPSTADAEQDDPTIRRCIKFAQDWKYAALTVVNLYGLRATDPDELWKATDPIGPDNDQHIQMAVGEANLVVAAWGATRTPNLTRAMKVRGMLGPGAVCLGKTSEGHPRHPLYVKANAVLVPLKPAETTP